MNIEHRFFLLLLNYIWYSKVQKLAELMLARGLLSLPNSGL